MFTGIIENTGTVTDITSMGSNKTFWIKSLISNELKVDQSVSHNGACLTVEETAPGHHRVTAVEETLSKTTLSTWKTGDLINLERCMIMNGRLDGHIVQGHVDTTGVCVDRKDMGGSWEFTFTFPVNFGGLIIEKGSVSLNGISLTLFNISSELFTVAVIPYTFENTNMKEINIGVHVNIEFDIIGKYIQRMNSLIK